MFGGPARWHSLIAERPREEGNPWNEFHVDYAGLKPEDSAVSMLGANGKVVSCGFAASPIENNISTIANDIKGDGVAAAPHVFVLNPRELKSWRKQAGPKSGFGTLFMSNAISMSEISKKWPAKLLLPVCITG